MKKFILFCILCSVLHGCKESAEEQGCPVIYADIEKIDKVSFFDIFSRAEIIPLETNDSSLIKYIYKVVYDNNRYYVFDYMQAEILTFDEAGKFLFKISDRGQGPEEYLNISDFDIDKQNDRIVVLDPINNAMFEYDLSGNFITRYKLPRITNAYKSFIYLNTDTLVYFTFDYDNRLKFYSKSKGVIFKELYPEKDNVLYNITLEFPYETTFFRSADNVVYEITQGCELTEKYRWDFGKLNNSKKQISKFDNIHNTMSLFPKVHNSEIINYIFTVQGRFSDFLCSRVVRKNKKIHIFHDQKNQKNYIFDKTSENATFHPLSWQDDFVIGYYADEWGHIDDTLPDAILDSLNISIKKSLKDDSNPVLIKYYFK